MSDDPKFKERLSDALSEPMPDQLATDLDRHIAALVARQPIGRPTAHRPALSRRRLGRSLLLVAALLIVAPTVYVASAAIMRSNEAPYGLTGVSGYETELAEAKAVTPIPPGATWPPYLNHGDPNVGYGVGLGRERVEMHAACLWENYWLDGFDRGDSAQVSAALAGLEKTRTWRTFTDPLTSDQGVRDLHRQAVDGAERADPGPVHKEYTAMCIGYVAPSGEPTNSGGV